MAKERARLAKQREKLAKDLAAVAARVSNQAFMSKAPPRVVAEAPPLCRAGRGGGFCLSSRTGSELRWVMECDGPAVLGGQQAQQDAVLECELTC